MNILLFLCNMQTMTGETLLAPEDSGRKDQIYAQYTER